MQTEQKTALVIIDVQNDYFPGGRWALEGAEAAGERARQVLGRCREQGVPVFHVRHSAPQGSPLLEVGTWGADIHPCVTPDRGETVIVKTKPNSFLGTDLQIGLQEAGATHLFVVGMMTNNCVDSTVRGAVEMGYTCTVLHDACAAMAFEFQGESLTAAVVHSVFMAELAFAYGEVMSTQQWLNRMN
ncbi:cysteine hydrolase family protein [Desulfovibrio ferrophilus]|uniref:Isochorismatase hydrolase n=1 Tax=Desulfovibrio ferrophilus TaxID=241368 RepID=A0A2Z6B2M4_9BACT|nr:cysteine hydrolase family protein [Desulfovibrio ferrophilus]BBD09769.1 isochorismatase hydrolase [Desulfovibrio ferrophilus]